MNVTVNDEVTTWMTGQTPSVKLTFNTKCTEALNDDLSTWRDVGQGVWDYRVSGNFRAVATRAGNNFDVAAIYSHATAGGKQYICGRVVNY